MNRYLKDIVNFQQLTSQIFNTYPQLIETIYPNALNIKNKIDRVDEFIQTLTSTVCPHCNDVCCKNKHGYYELADIIYIKVLNLEMPKYCDEIKEDDLCQFLTNTGCKLKRHMRPFRCNWHFCEALIDHMKNINQKTVRNFNKLFTSAIKSRGNMINSFVALVALSDISCDHHLSKS